MSILIKGIKMPRACQVCPLGHWNKLDKLTGCEIVRRYVPKDDIEFWEKDKPSWCPLVEVPTPHGRLIDDDALYKTYQEICSDIACISCPFLTEDGCKVEQMIMYAPTIIEAEEGADHE